MHSPREPRNPFSKVTCGTVCVGVCVYTFVHVLAVYMWVCQHVWEREHVLKCFSNKSYTCKCLLISGHLQDESEDERVSAHETIQTDPQLIQ